jgi:hypothetical protein
MNTGEDRVKKVRGEDRIRVGFNPSEDSAVADLKRRTAGLIDLCEALKDEGKDPRLCALAQTAYEEACMWAVKAATS